MEKKWQVASSVVRNSANTIENLKNAKNTRNITRNGELNS